MNNVNPCLLLVLEASTLLIYGCISQLFVFDFAIKNGKEHLSHCCRIFKQIVKTCGQLKEEKEFDHCFNGYYPISLLSLEAEWAYEPLTRMNDRLVFETDEFIWKFCDDYGLDGHEYAFKLGIAPKILKTIEVCGTWRLIKMEKIMGSTLRDDKNHDLTSWNHFVEKLNEFNEKFVHGDIRFPNIIRTEVDDTLKYYLLDFDWCSSISEKKYYPPSIDVNVFMIRDDKSFGACLPILVEHDKTQIKALTDWLISHMSCDMCLIYLRNSLLDMICS